MDEGAATPKPTPSFRNEDEEALHYLGVLRDGADADKIVARDRLAVIFERRGMLDEVVELYERNVRAGVRTPELYARLSQAYRRAGDLDRAEAALAEARRLHARRASAAARPAPSAPAPSQSTPDRPTAPPADAAPTQPPPPPAPSPPAAQPPPPASDEPRVMRFPAASRSDDAPAAVAEPATSEPATSEPAAPPPAPASLPPTLPRTGLTPAPATTGALARQALVDEAPAAPDDLNGRIGEPGAVAPAQPRPSGRAGLLTFVGIFLLMIVLPVAVLAVLVVNPIMLYAEGKPAGPRIDVQDRTPARVKVAPGWSSSLYLRDGRSVTGLWVTTGLDLVLEREIPGAGSRFAVTPAAPQTWGESITVVERRGSGRSSQDTIIPATFQAPASLPTSGDALTGRIVGQVMAPRLTEGGQFISTPDSIDAPIELEVVSVPALLLDRFGASFWMYLQEDRWLLVTIGALLCWCVLAGLTAVVVRISQAGR